MSPEQADGSRGLDARCDLYALGAIAYYMLTGRPPFEGDTPVEVMIAHARDPVVPPSRHVPSVPDDLEQVILRCLAKDPTARPSRRPRTGAGPGRLRLQRRLGRPTGRPLVGRGHERARPDTHL